MITSNYLQEARSFGISYGLFSLVEDFKLNLEYAKIDRMSKKRLKEIEEGKEWQPTFSEKVKSKMESMKAEKEAPVEEAGAEIIDEEEKVAKATAEDKEEKPTVTEEMVVVTSEKVIKEYEESRNDGIYQYSDDMLDTNIDDAITALPEIDPVKVKCTILSTLYIGAIISPEQVFKRLSSKNSLNELEIINTIVHFYSKITFCPSVSTLMLNEVFDKITELSSIMSFESSYKELHQNEALTEVFAKTRDLLIEFDKKIKEAHHDDSEAEIPLGMNFINGNLNITKPQGISKQVANQISKAFGAVLGKYSYQFNKINDLIELVIYNNGRMDSYLIDPGTIIGNGYNLIHYTGDMYQFINLKHNDIIEKLLDNKLYMLSYEEIQRIAADMFTNGYIYQMVDMTKGPEILPKLSEEDKHKLGLKLTAVLNLPCWTNGFFDGKIPRSRLRFRSFKSVDDFVLVSDDKCKSPLVGVTYGIITPGLVVKVSEDKITIKCGEDYSEDFEIKNYNVM